MAVQYGALLNLWLGGGYMTYNTERLIGGVLVLLGMVFAAVMFAVWQDSRAAGCFMFVILFLWGLSQGDT